MNKVKKILLPALLATAVAGVTGAVISATPVKASANSEAVFANVELTDGIVFNYYTAREDGQAAPKAVFDGAVASMDTEVTAVEDTYQGMNVWKFEYDKVTPQLLGEKFTISIGGSPVLTNYSVVDYCMELDSMTAGELGCTQNEYDQTAVLVKDLLFYGEAAKAYTTGGTISVNPVRGTDFVAPQDNTQLGTITSANKNFIQNATVVFENQPAIKFGLILNQPAGVTAWINEKEVAITQVEGKKYQVVYDGIMATKFDEQVTLVLKEGDTKAHEVTYGINDYVARVQDEDDANMVALSQALYCYGASADVVYAIPSYTNNENDTHVNPNKQVASAQAAIEAYVEDGKPYNIKTTAVSPWRGFGDTAANGLTTDGTYFYGIASHWQNGGLRDGSIYRYNPSDDSITVSDTKVPVKQEGSAGITLLDGKLYVYADDGTVYSLPTDFAADTALTTETLAFEGTTKIWDMGYNATLQRYAVKDNSNKLRIYESDKTTVVNAENVPTVTTSRMTVTEKYIYIHEFTDGVYLPTMKVFNWDGVLVGSITLKYDTTVTGCSEINLASASSVQGITFYNGDFYFVISAWRPARSDGARIFKVEATNDEHCTYVTPADYMGSAAVAGTTTQLDMNIIKDYGWSGMGMSYAHDITTDGEYIYGIAASSDNGKPRQFKLFRYNPKTGAFVSGAMTADKYTYEDDANITYYDGKVIIYNDVTKKLNYVDADKFTTATFAEYNDVVFTKDGTAMTITDFKYNPVTRQYVVKQHSTNLLYIFEADRTTYKQLTSVEAKSRMEISEDYIFVTDNADKQHQPKLEVYDWSGEAKGVIEIPVTPAQIGLDSYTQTNIQGFVFLDGAFYYTMAKWGGNVIDGGTTGSSAIIKAMPKKVPVCYYCGSESVAFSKYEPTQLPTTDTVGSAVNGVGDVIELPVISPKNYTCEANGNFATLTLKSNPAVSFTIEDSSSVNINGSTMCLTAAQFIDEDLKVELDGTTVVLTMLNGGEATISKLGQVENFIVQGDGKLTINSAYGSNAEVGTKTIKSGATLSINGAFAFKNLVIEEGATLIATANADTLQVWSAGTIDIAGTVNLTSGTTGKYTGINGKASNTTIRLRKTANVTITGYDVYAGSWGTGGTSKLVMPYGASMQQHPESGKSVPAIPEGDGYRYLIIPVNCNSGHTGAGSVLTPVVEPVVGVDETTAYSVDELNATFDGLTATYVDGVWTMDVAENKTVTFAAMKNVSSLVVTGKGILTVNNNISITNITINEGATLKVNVTAKDAVLVKNLVINGNIEVSYAAKTDATAINMLGAGSATLSATGHVTITNADYGFTCWNKGGAILTVPTGTTMVNGVLTLSDGTALETYTTVANKHNPEYYDTDKDDRGLIIKTEEGVRLQGKVDNLGERVEATA